MALIQCHECSGQISDHARICPHCGAPVIATIKRRQKTFLIGLGIRLVLAALIGLSLWFTLHHLFNQAFTPLKAIQKQPKSGLTPSDFWARLVLCQQSPQRLLHRHGRELL